MAIIFGGDTGIVENPTQGIFDEMKKSWDTIYSEAEAAAGMVPPPLEKVHIDDGFENVPGTAFVGSTIDNVDDIKQRRITSQEPHASIYIKKRAFWSLREENSTKLMDKGEKLYLRATKILFEKKCNQLASYEVLTKMSKLISEDADLDAARIEKIADVLGQYAGIMEATVEGLQDSISVDVDPAINDAIIEQMAEYRQSSEKSLELYNALTVILQKQGKLKQAVNTNWVIDPDSSTDVFNVGRGSGVIELTMFSNVNTSLGLENIEGSVSFTVQDPYNLMKITTDDVELALSAANAELKAIKHSADRSEILRGPQTILDDARNKEEKLRRIRTDRIASYFGTDRKIIGDSSVPEIIFEVSPTSYAQGKVAAYTTVDGAPSYDKDSLLLSMLQMPIEQQLSSEEQELVSEIFKLLDDYVAAIERLNVGIMDANSEEHVKYARRTLRLHYLGKSTIQPMDGVHVYIRGNTTKHGQNIGPFSKLLDGASFIQDAAMDTNAADAVLEEEMKQFGLEDFNIDVDLYRSFRTGSFMRNAGMHVFGGLITAATERYDAGSGTYVVNISGKSNARWLNLSRVNVVPTPEQPHGLLEDPLTAFSYTVDPGTGLIAEKPEPLPGNAAIMSTTDGEEEEDDSEESSDETKARLRFKSGVNKGKRITPNNWEQDYALISGSVIPIWKHVPGMVYKWKPGVMVASLDSNLSTSLQGSKDDTANMKRYVGITVTQEPFAGLDAADTVSLLTTGYPHSPERFYKAATVAGNFSAAGTNAMPSYFHSFFDITRSTNKALGNFEPFREIVTDGMAFTKKIALKGTLQKSYSEIERLRKEVAKAEDHLLGINRSAADKETRKLSSSADEKDREKSQKAWKENVKQLKDQIAVEESFIMENLNSAQSQGVIKDGSAIIFDIASLPSGIESEAHTEQNKNVRLKNKFLQMRTQYDCKFNTDKNLFIVSDEYDTNANIQAFILGLRNQQYNLWSSEYKHPMEICKNVADVLNFEFFCDTQGHLRFRPQQYNRVPLSLVLKMFMLNKNKGVQLYPDFLKQLFKSRLSTTEEEEEIVDAQIKIKALLLNLDDKYQDTDKLLVNVKSEVVQDNVIKGQYLKSVSPLDLLNNVSKISKLANSLELKTGTKNKLQDVAKIQSELNKYNNPATPNVNALRLKLSNEIKSLLSRKQQLNNLVEKLKEQGSAYEISSSDFNKEQLNDLLAPFGNLIEDDYNDFLGPGSSKRFIIYDDQIISFDFTEDEQNANCRADVTGQENLVGTEGSIVNNMPNIWAGATDFDMWRQYGYRSLGTTNKPFLKDADGQCAPYALFLLARARKDVVRGTITLYGNEYYQLGDVVYINSRDMLFYVSSVSQSFAYDGGSFTTTLELRYGHPLGEYIPTPFDVIGDSLVRNQKKFNKILVSRETSNTEQGVHLGMVIFENEEAEDGDVHKEMLSNRFDIPNVDNLKGALLVARNYITSTSEKVFPKVEVRGWCFNEKDKAKVQKRMNAVVTWLGTPVGRWQEHTKQDEAVYIKIGKQYVEAKLEKAQIYNNVVKNTKEEGKKPVEPINLSKKLEGEDLDRFRIPSEEIYNALPDDNRDPTNIIEIVLLFE